MIRELKIELTDVDYSRQEEVTFSECDRNGMMRIAALLSKIALFGGYDYDARGMTREVLLEMGYAFLLSRVAVRLHRCPRYGDVLTVRTWENGVKGAHMQRVFEMFDQEERLCVSAKSDWILVDPVSHKIHRPRGFTDVSLERDRKLIDCSEPGKIVLPKEGLEELGERRVVWSDLDGNGHLYSGRYGDIVWDYLPEDVQEKTPLEFYINYSKEAKLGDRLQLRGIREETGYRLEGLGAAGVCFSARIVY